MKQDNWAYFKENENNGSYAYRVKNVNCLLVLNSLIFGKERVLKVVNKFSKKLDDFTSFSQNCVYRSAMFGAITACIGAITACIVVGAATLNTLVQIPILFQASVGIVGGSLVGGGLIITVSTLALSIMHPYILKPLNLLTNKIIDICNLDVEKTKQEKIISDIEKTKPLIKIEERDSSLINKGYYSNEKNNIFGVDHNDNVLSNCEFLIHISSVFIYRSNDYIGLCHSSANMNIIDVESGLFIEFSNNNRVEFILLTKYLETEYACVKDNDFISINELLNILYNIRENEKGIQRKKVDRN